MTTEQAWRALADRFWEQLLELEPTLGTQIGDERFDDRLPDPTEAGLARRETVHRDALRQAQEIDRSGLGVAERTTLDVLEAIARRELDDVAYRFDRLRAASHLSGPVTMLATIATLQRADTPERLDRYVRRLSAFPEYVDAVTAILDEAAADGRTVPAVVADRAIGQTERLTEADVDQSPAMAPVAGGSDDDRDRVRKVIEQDVRPALGRLVEALRRYRTAAREDSLGLSALPRGLEMYAAQIRGWTSLSLAPEVIHDIGRQDLDRIEGERRAIAERLGFATADAAIDAINGAGRNVATSKDELVLRAQEQVVRGWEAAPGFFGRLPKQNCMVRPVEEFREDDMPFAYYFPPTADGARPGVYYVNTSSLEQRYLHRLATTTYHEANPGHHFQISIEQELGERHELRRFGGILAGSAFIEGWGLYSERLADEMELYVDQYERLGMLEAQGMRAARLVVDTGLHALGWERQQAIDLLVSTGMAPVDAAIETDRYIAEPGQALAYKLGQLEIERWRAEAKQRAGGAFSIADFHDRLLALGSLPLAALDRELATPAQA